LHDSCNLTRSILVHPHSQNYCVRR
jgi:hypothetical protein